MILHQGAGDMDNRYFPGTDLETMPGIGGSFKSRHFLASTSSWVNAHARLARLAALTTRKGGTAGKADNLRAAFFLRGAGYEPHEHV